MVEGDSTLGAKCSCGSAGSGQRLRWRRHYQESGDGGHQERSVLESWRARRWPLELGPDEIEISGIDHDARAFTEDEDRIAAVKGVREQRQRSADGEEPERDG